MRIIKLGDIGKTRRKIEIIPVPEPAESPVTEPAAPVETPVQEPVPA